MESKWITIVETKFPERMNGKPKKTKTFYVLTKPDNVPLGLIQWYSPWRKYSFYPATGTIFERRCMLDIVQFMDDLMTEKKKKDQSKTPG